MNRHLNLSYLYLLFCAVALLSCERTGKTKDICCADSLNERSYNFHYRNLDSTLYYADLAYKASTHYAAGRAEALNNRSFYLFMKMDFQGARKELNKIYSTTDNEIELLIADISMMRICQRTSDNKEFYDYRNRAVRRIRRIAEEKENFDEREQKRLIYAQSDFHIVSSVYYYYLQQQKQSMDEILKVVPDGEIRKDTAQLLMLYYMKGSGGMCEGDSSTQISLRELDYLTSCINLSHSAHYPYFEANSLQALSEMLLDPSISKILYQYRPKDIHSFNTENVSDSLLPLSLSRKALSLFKHYDDYYQIAGTYRTIAGSLFQLGKYHDALDSLQVALDYVNRHHSKYYHCTDSTHLLTLYRSGEKTSLEMQWLRGGKIKTVSEWIARLREQISLTYSALGMKLQSDYNRNIYLDILDVTRQDKEWESRYDTLERESKQMSVLTASVLFTLIFIVVILFFANYIWRKNNSHHIEKIKQILEICRKVTNYIPEAQDSIPEIANSLTRLIQNEMKNLFGCSAFRIYILGNNEEGASQTEVAETNACNLSFPLLLSDKNIHAEIQLQTVRRLSKDEKMLIKVLLPYVAWTLENANIFLLLGDRRKQLEKEKNVYEQHIIDNKRENLNKKACMALVNNITPFLDRIINDVNKLNTTSDKCLKQERYQYISELINRINEYNEILSLWIKMRRGILSLHIENFPLSEIFNIVGKSRMSFEMKQQCLEIEKTHVSVKADKALTLFMLNTLMENARKYTPQGGHIKVKADEQPNYIEISVIDDGPGLSRDDVLCILGEKVYDSKRIGLNHGENNEAIRQSKGYGFGLINCKGIIEKYRKTGSVFSVCEFHIDSVLGKGSRFSFRLPKSIITTLSVLIGILFFISCGNPQSYNRSQHKNLASGMRDSFLISASHYADSAYYSNVYGYYKDALMYTDSALNKMNKHIRLLQPKARMATLTGESDAAETDWLLHHYDADYYILLDVRNEAAVAALALRQWNIYKYNNNAYTTLYKMVGEDHDLEAFCKKMQASASNKMVGLFVCIILFLCLIFAYYIMYFRRRMLYRLNLEQVLEINHEVFACTVNETPESDDTLQRVPQTILNEIYNSVDALRPIKAMGLTVYNGNSHQFNKAYRQTFQTDRSRLEEFMRESFENKKTIFTDDRKIVCYPLIVETSETSLCIGSLGIAIGSNPEEGDNLLGELIARYISIAIFNASIRIQHSLQEIDEAQNSKQRAIFEETQLHIQNQVLDNCFSALKHETLYYPTRIQQIVGKLTTEVSQTTEKEQQDTLSQLVNYYKEIFTLLSSCASRQLQEITFKRSVVSIDVLREEALKYVVRMNRRKKSQYTLQTDMPVAEVIGDIDLLRFMTENLLEEASDNCAGPSTVFLKAIPQDDFVRFEFTNPEQQLAQDELDELFYPRLDKMRDADGNLKGTEYLLCKQIIREHDEYTGHKGCRIIAEKCPTGGTTIWWTILRKK